MPCINSNIPNPEMPINTDIQKLLKKLEAAEWSSTTKRMIFIFDIYNRPIFEIKSIDFAGAKMVFDGHGNLIKKRKKIEGYKYRIQYQESSLFYENEFERFVFNLKKDISL